MRLTDILSARNRDAFGNPPAKIVCLGDSVTHGCFDVYINRYGNVDTVYDSTQGYVRRLQDQLLKLFPASAVSVINSGISGDNTAGALARFERDVAVFRPDFVTVNLALNDCMADDIGKALAKYRSNLIDILSRIRALGAEAMLITPNMMCTYIDPSLPSGQLQQIAAQAAERQNGGVLDRFVDAAREIAHAQAIPVADAYAVWTAYSRNGADTTRLLSNRINHPAADMHDIFVQKILEQLFK